MAATYVPRIEEQEFSLLKQELTDNFLGIAFDGTSRLGEAVNITGRFCTAKFSLEKRLLRFITAKLHMKGAEFSSLITQVLCRELQVAPDMVVCLSRDSVLVNGVACRLLMQSTFVFAENQMCIAHTLNNVGSHINFDTLSQFMTPWLELIGGRHPHRGAQGLWRTAVSPQQVPGFSNVRWYSTAEIQFVMAENYDKIKPLLDQLDLYKYGDATRRKLRDVIDSPAKAKSLKLQLAAMLDMRPLVRTTYELEGDGLEMLLVYNRLEFLRELGKSIRAGASGVLSNVDATIRADIQLTHGVEVEMVPDEHACLLVEILNMYTSACSWVTSAA